MKEKIKNYSYQFVKEIIPVIAGILIALYIDNWNSERKDKAYLSQVFSTINNELNDTKEEISELLPQQKSLIDSLELHAHRKNSKILDVVMKSKGIYIPQVKINAWKSISNSKIDLVDYKKIALLSNLEELKLTLYNKTDFLMNFLYSNINATDYKTKQTLKMILLDIVNNEKMLQRNIELFEKNNEE